MAGKKAKDTEEILNENLEEKAVEPEVEEVEVAEEDIEDVEDDDEEEDIEDEEEDIEDEDMTAALQLLSKVFKKRRYNMMSKEEQRSAYKNQKVSGRKGNYKTEKDLIKEEAQELMAAAQSVPPLMLKGIVYGYEFSDSLGIPLILVTREDKPHFVIKIPVSQFFVYDERTYIGDEGKRALERELKSRIGSEIEFVVFDLQEKECVAIASRLSALERRSHINYKTRPGKKTPFIQNGGRASAKVVCVKNNLVKVEISGIETIIRSEELSWRALESLTQEFEVGDEFEVIVDNIEEFEYEALNRKYKLYSASASKRLAEPNPAEQYFNQFSVGQRIGGKVKTHNEVGVFVDLAGKVDILCPHPASGMVVRGQKCIVEITSMDEKKFRLYGRIV